jgi:hypothetical protein
VFEKPYTSVGVDVRRIRFPFLRGEHGMEVRACQGTVDVLCIANAFFIKVIHRMAAHGIDCFSRAGQTKEPCFWRLVRCLDSS